MKKIYLIRHGESDGNVGPNRQDASTPLSEKGREQARFAAKRFAKIPVDVIISSTMLRAHDTAEIIASEVSKEIKSSDLFAEMRFASEVLCKPKNSPESIKFFKEVNENFTKPGWRYMDAENFDDLKARGLAALDYLKNLPEENILVVMHGAFMRILMSCVMFGEKLSAHECQSFWRTLTMENTGISCIIYNEKSSRPWGIWIWNDHAHLG